MGKRRYYRSNQFMLTIEQIEWLTNQPNASQVIRRLLTLAMSNEDFENNCVTLNHIEKQIAILTKNIEGNFYRSTLELSTAKQKLEERKQMHKKLLARLLKPS